MLIASYTPPPAAAAAKCASCRMRFKARPGGMGDVNEGDPLSSSRADWERKLAATLTNLQLYKLVAPFPARVQQMIAIAKDTASVTAERLEALQGIGARIQTVRNAIKVKYAGAPNQQAPDQAAARAAILELLDWVNTLLGTKFKTQNAQIDALKRIAAAPFKAAGFTLEQLLAALHLPPWAPAAALAVLGLVVVGPMVAPLVGRAIASRRTA